MSEYIVKAADWVIDYNGDSAFKDCERIVRCRDCRHFDNRLSYPLCRRDMSCDELAVYAEPNGFCAWGEGRVDNERA